MRAKLARAFDRFDTWYWISGAREIVELSWKVGKFFGCFMITGILVMGGLMHLQEVRNIDPNSLESMFFAFIGFYVMMMGAVTVAKS